MVVFIYYLFTPCKTFVLKSITEEQCIPSSETVPYHKRDAHQQIAWVRPQYYITGQMLKLSV